MCLYELVVGSLVFCFVFFSTFPFALIGHLYHSDILVHFKYIFFLFYGILLLLIFVVIICCYFFFIVISFVVTLKIQILKKQEDRETHQYISSCENNKTQVYDSHIYVASVFCLLWMILTIF